MAQFSKLSALSVALAAGTLSTAPAAAAELSDQASTAASTLPQVEIFTLTSTRHRGNQLTKWQQNIIVVGAVIVIVATATAAIGSMQVT